MFQAGSIQSYGAPDIDKKAARMLKLLQDYSDSGFFKTGKEVGIKQATMAYKFLQEYAQQAPSSENKASIIGAFNAIQPGLQYLAKNAARPQEPTKQIT